VHPRTVTRWEIGETKPSADEWSRLVALFTTYAPQAADALAAAAGVPSALPPPRAVDLRAIDAAIIRAADRLDVAPRRVRAALRDIVTATESANGTLSDLAAQANEDEMTEA